MLGGLAVLAETVFVYAASWSEKCIKSGWWRDVTHSSIFDFNCVQGSLASYNDEIKHLYESGNVDSAMH